MLPRIVILLSFTGAQVPLSISTDDQGLFRSLLTNEYAKAVQWYDLDYNALTELVRNSIEYAFLPGESLYQDGDYRRLRPEFKKVRGTAWKPSKRARQIIAENPKLARQVKLERALLAYDACLSNGLRCGGWEFEHH